MPTNGGFVVLALLFILLRCARKVHEDEFPQVEYQEMIIDAGCMRLVQDPTAFDVLLLENLYGDVVSDLAAGLVGGLGVVPGANMGDDLAVFEAVHGSAPDIAGHGVANPLALLMSAVMMLNHLADTRRDPRCRETAERIKRAYNQALADGQKTGDLGGKLSTEAFADAVIDTTTSRPTTARSSPLPTRWTTSRGWLWSTCGFPGPIGWEPWKSWKRRSLAIGLS